MRGSWSQYQLIIITISVHKLDNTLYLGFPIELVVKNVRTTLDFTGNYDSQIDNRGVITKQ